MPASTYIMQGLTFAKRRNYCLDFAKILCKILKQYLANIRRQQFSKGLPMKCPGNIHTQPVFLNFFSSKVPDVWKLGC